LIFLIILLEDKKVNLLHHYHLIISIVVISFLLTVRDVEVNMDEYSYFREHSRARVASKVSNEYFGWTMPIYLEIMKNSSFTSEDEKKLLEILKEVKELKGITGTMGALDVLRELHVSLPILQMASKFSPSLKEYVSKGYLKIFVKSPYTGTKDVRILVEKMKNILNKYDYRYRISGPVVSLVKMNEDIVKDQVLAVILSLAFILSLLFGVYRNFKESLFATIPIALTILFAIFVMAISGISLEISTVIVVELLMGLVIDYSCLLYTSPSPRD
jgi:predicted RND superfamily exporter protein